MIKTATNRFACMFCLSAEELKHVSRADAKEIADRSLLPIDSPEVMDDNRSHIIHDFELCAKRKDEADPHCVVSRLAKLFGSSNQVLVDRSRGGSKNTRVGRTFEKLLELVRGIGCSEHAVSH